jgi:hypothetical protein
MSKKKRQEIEGREVPRKKKTFHRANGNHNIFAKTK